MRLTVLVCALTCLLIAPHAYAEGGLAAAADWCQVVVGLLAALAAVVAVRVAQRNVVLLRTQVDEMRKTYQAQAFLDMTQRMRDFRDVRRMLHAVCECPECKFPGCEWERYVEEDRIRDYLAFLNASAFLSDGNRDALPRKWILGLWAPAIKATWPGAWHYIKKWRKAETKSGKRLFDHFEKLAEECVEYEAAEDSQADS